MTIAVQQSKDLVSFDTEQKSLIKNYLCKGINDEELTLFAAVCKKTGLDPFMKQIYAVKRKNYKTGLEDMTIQTSIDGYRLIAERTGRYVPGSKSTFEYKDGQVFSATSYVKKMTSDGIWHEISVEAFMDEYKPPITKNGYENPFWKDKPHIMLAKCAESLALRKAFPNELSGLYSEEEMHQTDSANKDLISNEEVEAIESLLYECPPDQKQKVLDFIYTDCKAAGISQLNKDVAKKIRKRLEDIVNSKTEATGTENT